VKSSVSGWIGKIDSLSTTDDGKAVLTMKLSCEGGTLKTWNSALSDIGDNTLIPQSSKLYDTLSDVGEGKTVSFGGAFIHDDKDGS
jgi:hypothetical protein